MTLNKTGLSLAITLALAGSTTFANTAKEKNGEKEIEEVVVNGQYLSIDKLNSVKTPTPILNVPQSLSIVSGEQIQKQGFTSVGDILRYTPGLSISQGEGHRDAAIIRGIQTTADFFIDGIRDDVQYYRPLYNVEQVEVLRGSNALLFGRGGGGGVINRVQKRANVGDDASSISASIDSFGAYSVAGDTNFTAGQHSAFRINGLYQELKNHRDFYEGSVFAVNPTVSFNLGTDTSAMVSYEYLDDDRVVDRGVPSVNVDDPVNTPLTGHTDTFFGSSTENFATNKAHILRARIDHDFSKNLRGNLSAQYADFDKYYQNLYASSAVTLVDGNLTEVELDGYSDATERQNLIIQGNLVGEFSTAGLGHTLLVGAEYGDQDTKNARFDNVFAENDSDKLTIPFTRPLIISEFSFSDLDRDRESNVTFTSLYIQDNIDLTDNFKLIAGLRYDQFDIDVIDIKNDSDFSRKDSEITQRYGFIYKPAKNLSFYASYSETFLPRSGEQFLTLDIKAESTRPQFFENNEIGLKWDLDSGLSFTTAIFELDRESYTSVDPTDPSELIVVEGSVTTGIEFQLSGNLTEKWDINMGYSYLDGEVERADSSETNGNKTRQTPENMFSIWNNIVISDALSFGIGGTYQDSFFISEDNSVEVPSYTRIDAAVFYQVNTSTHIQLNIENLLDTEYFPDAHSNNNISTGKPLNARLSFVKEF